MRSFLAAGFFALLAVSPAWAGLDDDDKKWLESVKVLATGSYNTASRLSAQGSSQPGPDISRTLPLVSKFALTGPSPYPYTPAPARANDAVAGS